MGGVLAREARCEVLASIRASFVRSSPMGRYAGDKLRDAMALRGHWNIEIIRRSDTTKDFETTLESLTT